MSDEDRVRSGKNTEENNAHYRTKIGMCTDRSFYFVNRSTRRRRLLDTSGLACAVLFRCVQSRQCVLRQSKLGIQYFQQCLVYFQGLLNEGLDGRFHTRVDSLRVSAMHRSRVGQRIVF